MKETQIREAMIQYIFAIGGWATRVPAGEAVQEFLRKNKETGEMEPVRYRLRLADIGTPDILGCIKGKFIAIEVKVSEARINEWWNQKTKTSRAQLASLEKLQDIGAHCFISCSLDDLISQLRKDKIIK